MSEWTYRFTDFLTGALLCELPLSGVTLADPLGEDGTFSATINLSSDVAKENGVGSLVQAYRTGVFAIRSVGDEAAPTVPWAGQVLKVSYSSADRVLSLTCSQIWQWVGKQLIELDLDWTDADQFEIVRDTLAYVLGRPNATIPINLGAGISGISKTKEWRARAGKTVEERLAPLMERANGPLLQFDGEYRTAIDTRFLLRQVISDNPPAPAAQRRLVFDFPNGNVSAYELDEDGAEQPVTNTKARAGLIRTIPDPKLRDRGNWTLNDAIDNGWKKNDLVRFDHPCTGAARYFVAERDIDPRSNNRNRGLWTLADSNSESTPYLNRDVVRYANANNCEHFYVASADIQHDPNRTEAEANPIDAPNWNEDDISPDGEGDWQEIDPKDRFVDVVHQIHDKRSNDDLLSEGWPRRTLYTKLEDTRHASDVEDASASLMRGKGKLALELVLRLAPTADPPYGTYRTGDYVWLQIEDPLRPLSLRRWSQIVQMDTTPLPSGEEEVTVTVDVTV